MKVSGFAVKSIWLDRDEKDNLRISLESHPMLDGRCLWQIEQRDRHLVLCKKSKKWLFTDLFSYELGCWFKTPEEAIAFWGKFSKSRKPAYLKAKAQGEC